LFDSWAVALADHTPESLLPRRESILAAARHRMEEDSRYAVATTQSTGDFNRVKLRFEVARYLLQQAGR
jgi:hypothetical protein